MWCDTYGHSSGDGSSESEDLSGQHPPHQTNAVGALVVAGDGDVNKLGGGVHVAEGNDGDVGIASLGDGLVVSSGVGDDEEPGLTEGGLDLIGEGSRSESSSDWAAVDIPTIQKYHSQFIIHRKWSMSV